MQELETYTYIYISDLDTNSNNLNLKLTERFLEKTQISQLGINMKILFRKYRQFIFITPTHPHVHPHPQHI